MKLYLMRHGIALATAEAGVRRDEDRPLSKDGRRKTAAIVEGLRAMGCRPAIIAASPLLRAAETAGIVARAYETEAASCDALQPGGDIREFTDWLRRCSPGDVLAVGHMPDLSEFVSRLLTATADARFDFGKGAVACLSLEGTPRAGSAWMEWMLPARYLRALRGMET